MHAVRQGSGRPLLLVHGLGSSLHNWAPIMGALAGQREVIAIDLPGFGETPPLLSEVSIATLTDAVQEYIRAEGLHDVDLVGSSMGARMVLEMARRGHGGTTVALDPGGFWTEPQLRVFNASIKASVALVRNIQPALPFLTGTPAGRTALMAQFSARPWRLPAELVLRELRGFKTSKSLDEALDSLVNGPRQQGAPAGSLNARVVIGWGAHDKVTLPSQSKLATGLFPDASLHWFDRSGHFPHWDQPAEVIDLILSSTSSPGPSRTGTSRRQANPVHTNSSHQETNSDRRSTMTKEENIATQQRWGAAVNDGDLAVLDALVAPDSVDHDPAPGQGPGPKGFQDMFSEMRTAFPDLHVEVEHLTATDDDIALAYTLTGTQQGELMGHAPTGKPVKVRGMQIGRFVDGKLVERWGSSDQLGMLTQLGLVSQE